MPFWHALVTRINLFLCLMLLSDNSKQPFKPKIQLKLSLVSSPQLLRFNNLKQVYQPAKLSILQLSTTNNCYLPMISQLIQLSTSRCLKKMFLWMESRSEEMSEKLLRLTTRVNMPSSDIILDLFLSYLSSQLSKLKKRLKKLKTFLTDKWSLKLPKDSLQELMLDNSTSLTFWFAYTELINLHWLFTKQSKILRKLTKITMLPKPSRASFKPLPLWFNSSNSFHHVNLLMKIQWIGPTSIISLM